MSNVLITCADGMRLNRDLEPQAGAVGCVVGFDFIIAKATGEMDAETKAPIFHESHRIPLEPSDE